jgi:hypothetical protein
MIVIIPHYISHQFNAFFVENVDRSLNQNMDCKSGQDSISNKILNPNSMFLAPITEDEVLKVTSELNSKFSAGYDEIPEKLVKESIQFIKKPLPFIFNISLCSGTFQNCNEDSKSLAYSQKKERNKKFPIIDQFQFFQFFKKYLKY